MIRVIAHPTDFSAEGMVAFEHALALALLNRCALMLLHVYALDEPGGFKRFPQVRDTLRRWRCLAPDAEQADVLTETGVKVTKVDLRDDEAIDGLAGFLKTHRPDLLVMATHGRAGIERWLKGSVSAGVASQTLVPTLVFGRDVRPFVASDTGAMNIRSVVVPVDHNPSANLATRKLVELTEALKVPLDYVHVGERAPAVWDGSGGSVPIRNLDGPVVDALVNEAASASLLAMTTAGRHGFLDAIRGTTTERVVSRAGCPILVLPVVAS
jgi:nucleotide-binding universal stress UspA family protein